MTLSNERLQTRYVKCRHERQLQLIPLLVIKSKE